MNENALCLEPFSLAELVHDVAGKFAPQAEAAGIRLMVQAAPGAVRAAADIDLIDRAITNLVENALHATSKGGQVTLTSQPGAGTRAEFELPLADPRDQIIN